MANVGDIVIFTSRQGDRDNFMTTDPSWPAIVVKAFSPTDCLLQVFTSGTNYSGQMAVRCNEDDSATPAEGTFKPKA